MGKVTLMTVVVGLILAVAASTGLADAVTNAADKLVADQEAGGSWPEVNHGTGDPIAGYAGEPTIGLCHAYELTSDLEKKDAYKTKAQAGGDYSLTRVVYNSATRAFGDSLYGSEVYAMSRLSEIDGNAVNPWRTALLDYMDYVWAAPTIVDYQDNDEDSSAVYNVARMAVAADYVKGEMEYPGDATDYRNGVITLLGDVDDTDGAPVMALGAAVWALASTGDINTDTTEVWAGVLVQDLPELLADRQAADGSFYAALDSDVGSGWTETTAMATLGLMAADATLYATEIADAVGVLEGGVVDPGGDVYREIGVSGSGAYYFAAGETLEVIPEPATMT